MDNITLEEPVYQAPAQAARKPSMLSQLAISWGLARDEKGAQRVLLIVAVVAFLAAVGIFFSSPANRPDAALPPSNIPGEI